MGERDKCVDNVDQIEMSIVSIVSIVSTVSTMSTMSTISTISTILTISTFESLMLSKERFYRRRACQILLFQVMTLQGKSLPNTPLPSDDSTGEELAKYATFKSRLDDLQVKTSKEKSLTSMPHSSQDSTISTWWSVSPSSPGRVLSVLSYHASLILSL